MVQGYYTLDEAADILGVGADELSQMAQRREVRAFADGATWRFRTQDIEELARRRGRGSDPAVPLADGPITPRPKLELPASDPSVFDFTVGSDDQVEIGQEIISDSPSGSRKTTGKSSSRNVGPRTPPKAGSDSDVRLVPSSPTSDAGSSSKSGRRTPGQDSGVQLVGMGTGSDSDVKIVPDSKDDLGVGLGKSGSDSDIRLEPGGPKSKRKVINPEDSFLTEEIDLDAELKKAEESAHPRKPAPKPRPKQPPTPDTSPFELSDSDLQVPDQVKPAKAESSGNFDLTAPMDAESSSDFDLSLDATSDSAIELSSGELTALQAASPDEVPLGSMPRGSKQGSDSGISLRDPVDSGISLERGDETSDSEFEISLDEGESATPKPVKAAATAESSSEFELTLEDSAKLAPMDDDPGLKPDESKDIFETDFEVPALEDESGSQAVALDESDTDLESSDFDLALGDEDIAAEEASGSQVVALEEESDVDEGAATIARPRKRISAADDEDDAGDFAVAEEPEILGEEEESGRPVLVSAAAPAWGVFAPIVLIFSTLILLLVGFMSIELVHGMWGYRQPYKSSSWAIRNVGGLLAPLLPGIDPKDLEKD